MGVGELIERLQRDADARVAAVEARANADVAAIAAAANEASSRAASMAIAERRTRRRARLETEIVEATRAARATRLRAEHALLDRVLVRAAALLEEGGESAAYLDALPARLREALLFADGGGARVRCRPALAAAVWAALAGDGGATVEEVPTMPAGFSLLAGDGSVEIDETLRARLERMRPRVLIALLAEVNR